VRAQVRPPKEPGCSRELLAQPRKDGTTDLPRRPAIQDPHGWRAELFSARPVVEGFSAMLGFGQLGVDLDNDVLAIDGRRQHQILRA